MTLIGGSHLEIMDDVLHLDFIHQTIPQSGWNFKSKDWEKDLESKVWAKGFFSTGAHDPSRVYFLSREA